MRNHYICATRKLEGEFLALNMQIIGYTALAWRRYDEAETLSCRCVDMATKALHGRPDNPSTLVINNLLVLKSIGTAYTSAELTENIIRYNTVLRARLLHLHS
jgi:hypothetical protein